jgi:hypothetical protein
MNISLIQIIEQKDELLRQRWNSSVKALQSRIDLFQSDSAVFGEIHQLMISLISIVENKESAEQAVDAQLKPIVFRLRDLQSTCGGRDGLFTVSHERYAQRDDERPFAGRVV